MTHDKFGDEPEIYWATQLIGSEDGNYFMSENKEVTEKVVALTDYEKLKAERDEWREAAHSEATQCDSLIHNLKITKDALEKYLDVENWREQKVNKDNSRTFHSYIQMQKIAQEALEKLK